MKFSWFICLLIVSSLQAYSQNPVIDSLRNQLEMATEDSAKINLYNQLSWELAGIDPQMALTHAQKALEIASEKDMLKEKALALKNLGIIYDNIGSYDTTLQYYHRALEIYTTIGDSQGVAKIYNNIGIIHYYERNFDKTLEYWFEAIRIFDELGNKNGVAAIYNNIANIHLSQHNYEKAHEYNLRSLEIRKKIGNPSSIGHSYFNLGNVYYELGNETGLRNYYDSALYYHFKSLEIKQELNSLSGIALSFNNIGTIYDTLNRNSEALTYFRQALELNEQLGNQMGLAESYRLTGQSYIKNNQIERGIAALKRSLDIAREIGSFNDQITAYKSLADAHEKAGRYNSALRYHKLYAALQDTILRKESKNRFAEMQTKYEMEKKDQMMKQAAERHRIESARQRVIIYSTIGGLIMVVILIFLLYNRYRLKQKANEKLALQNLEIQKQKEEIEKQRNIAIIQRDRIQEQQKHITDSIMYAQRIQRAILPPENYIDEILPEHFIFYQPREIVSGDYYWITQKGDKVVIAAADSTGHGVPGAFMSMLGVAFLNEIVNKQQEIVPAVILNELRKNVINSLHQTGKHGESRDGIDMALVVFNQKTRELQYAGANNPLYIVKKANGLPPDEMCLSENTRKSLIHRVKNEDHELFEMKADRMPIGFHPRGKRPFTNHQFKLDSNSSFYIFTDGFADQFGGPKGKKFYYAPFRQLILDLQNKPMNKQLDILKQTITEWRGDIEQIDDLLIIGVRAD